MRVTRFRRRAMNDCLDKKQVFLVDDHPLICEWLKELINQQEDLSVCGNADTAPEALQLVEKLRPDVAVVDITLRRGSGIDLLKDIRRCSPKTLLVVLTMHEESLYAERALRAGARAYIRKRDATVAIIEAIRTVLQGHTFVAPEFASIFLERFMGTESAREQSPLDQLSNRELEVFLMLGDGLDVQQVADALGVSASMVHRCCVRIKESLGVKTFAELVRDALRWRHAPQA